MGALAMLLFTAPGPAAAQPVAAPIAAAQVFAPPLGVPMTYRVIVRRPSRDGTMLSFTLVYDLRWSRVGRGYRIDAMAKRIDSDARPELVQALTAVMQPLIGETIAYLVAGDGSRVDLVDSAALWNRVIERTEALAAGSGRADLQQVVKMFAEMPAAERDAFAAEDIRALVAPANPALTGPAVPGERLRHIAVARTDDLPGERPVEVETAWDIDTATGLVVREREQSWLTGAEPGERTLVAERVRALDLP